MTPALLTFTPADSGLRFRASRTSRDEVQIIVEYTDQTGFITTWTFDKEDDRLSIGDSLRSFLDHLGEWLVACGSAARADRDNLPEDFPSDMWELLVTKEHAFSTMRDPINWGATI